MQFTQWVVPRLKTLTNQVKTRNKRETIILLCVLVGFVTPYFITELNLSYEAHYFTGVVRSFLTSILIFQAFLIVKSVRLIILMVLYVIDMSCDVASLVSTDLYWTIKPLRYNNETNFSKIFKAYEIFCFATCGVNYFRPTYLDGRRSFNSSKHH